MEYQATKGEGEDMNPINGKIMVCDQCKCLFFKEDWDYGDDDLCPSCLGITSTIQKVYTGIDDIQNQLDKLAASIKEPSK